MSVLSLYSASMLDKRYPGAWDVSTGKGYKIAHKQYGKFIATVLSFPGEQALWRVKEMNLVADDDINAAIYKVYKLKRAGRAVNMSEAMNWISLNVLPVLFSLSDVKEDVRGVRKEVEEVLG